MSEMPKKLVVLDFASEIKRMENYPDFDKLAYVIQYGIQGFTVKKYRGRVNKSKRP